MLRIRPLAIAMGLISLYWLSFSFPFFFFSFSFLRAPVNTPVATSTLVDVLVYFNNVTLSHNKATLRFSDRFFFHVTGIRIGPIGPILLLSVACNCCCCCCFCCNCFFFPIYEYEYELSQSFM